MGTAVRSGENRAREAAQAAMASPLLEAGAIDGARGILINITGSSSLKLSEVNEASSLIQSAAHEDANIIFGAVQDENMGEEVKVTVIATGFRGQMPERRARMLEIEETPIVSVPVVAPDAWLGEQDQEANQKANQPEPPRFMSEQDDEPGTGTMTFAAAAPSVATTVSLTAPAAAVLADESETPAPQRAAVQPEQEAPRDYAAEFPPMLHNVMAEETQPAPLFTEAQPAEQQDLDVPAFMRRSQF
jgi:cell division protein FtsZ